LTAKPPPYSAILELDHKIRQKHLPSHLNVFLGPTDGAPSAYMKACMHGQFRSISKTILQYIEYTTNSLQLYCLFIEASLHKQCLITHPIHSKVRSHLLSLLRTVALLALSSRVSTTTIDSLTCVSGGGGYGPMVSLFCFGRAT